MIDMGRRGFIALAAAILDDPERLIWRPGQRLISIPAAEPLFDVRVIEAWNIYENCMVRRFDVMTQATAEQAGFRLLHPVAPGIPSAVMQGASPSEVHQFIGISMPNSVQEACWQRVHEAKVMGIWASLDVF